MDLSQYGPFASVIAIAAALISVFSLLLLKAVGKVSHWTWLINDTPPFLITAGARALAVALIAAAFLLIDRTNYKLFVACAVLFGILTFILIGWFDRLRRAHICKVPMVQNNGAPVSDAKGQPLYESLVVGREDDMNPHAKKAFKKARQEHGGVSLCNFMSGYGATAVNNPSAIWSLQTLAGISNRLTVVLMGVLLCAVMALYLAASSIEVQLRPIEQAEKSN